jgi:hypothetical protein
MPADGRCYFLGEPFMSRRAAAWFTVFCFAFFGAVWVGEGVGYFAEGSWAVGTMGVVSGMGMLFGAVVYARAWRRERKQRAVGSGGGSPDGPRG